MNIIEFSQSLEKMGSKMILDGDFRRYVLLKARKRHPEAWLLRMTCGSNRHCFGVVDSDEECLAE